MPSKKKDDVVVATVEMKEVMVPETVYIAKDAEGNDITDQISNIPKLKYAYENGFVIIGQKKNRKTVFRARNAKKVSERILEKITSSKQKNVIENYAS